MRVGLGYGYAAHRRWVRRTKNVGTNMLRWSVQMDMVLRQAMHPGTRRHLMYSAPQVEQSTAMTQGSQFTTAWQGMHWMQCPERMTLAT